MAQSVQPSGSVAAQLQLSVTINGQPTHYISQFSDLGGGRLASARKELEELGVKLPGAGAPDDLVVLDSLPALKYAYDSQTQSVDLTLADEYRLRKTYSAIEGNGPTKPQPSNVGAVLNYDLFAASQQSSLRAIRPAFQGANATLDGRLVSPWGMLSQSGIVGTTLTQESDLLRLQTTYAYDDVDTLTSYRAGDTISGALNWTRPFRFGGLQMQRDFALRPDLITTAIPTLNGSAAVPSTVDVYVNNIKAYSQQVGAGPFQINDVPMLTGAGNARVVVQDAAGHLTETTTPFFTAPRVLKEGIFDYSIEGGLPRRSYGLVSDDYGSAPLGSASLRFGIADWLTAEAHSEGGGGLANGGAGVVARIGNRAVVSAAVAGSHVASGNGIQLYGSLDTHLDQITLHAHTQRSFASYEDLASVTAQQTYGTITAISGVPFVTGSIGTLKPPRAADAISISLPTLIDQSNVNLAYLHLAPVDGKVSQLLSLSYTRPLFDRASLFATAFKDINDSRSAGAFVGVSVSLGNGVSGSSSFARSAAGNTVSADIAKPLGQEVGSVGWSLHDSEGGNAYRYGSASYRDQAARLEGTVRQNTNGVRTTAEAEGTLVAMGGGIYAANRIDDGFAVVSVGSPGVKVLRDNNVVGETDDDGKLLIPNLNSYQRNKIAIDANGLPLNTEIDETSKTVTPGLKGGIDVTFAVRKGIASAIVILRTADGRDVPAGSIGRLDGASETFVVGYDGRAYLKGLKRDNNVVVTLAGQDCKASFNYKAVEDTQAVVGPIVCR